MCWTPYRVPRRVPDTLPYDVSRPERVYVMAFRAIYLVPHTVLDTLSHPTPCAGHTVASHSRVLKTRSRPAGVRDGLARGRHWPQNRHGNLQTPFRGFVAYAGRVFLWPYRGTSLIRNRHPVGPYRRTMPRLLWRSLEGGGGLMSEVPL